MALQKKTELQRIKAHPKAPHLAMQSEAETQTKGGRNIVKTNKQTKPILRPVILSRRSLGWPRWLRSFFTV